MAATSADGQRVGSQPRCGLAGVYGPPAARLLRLRLGLWRFGSVSRLLYSARTLDLFDLRVGAAGSGVCGVYEEVLSFA